MTHYYLGGLADDVMGWLVGLFPFRGATRGWPTRPVPARVGPGIRDPVVAPPGAVTYGPAPPGYTIQVPPRQVLPGIIPTSRPGGYIEHDIETPSAMPPPWISAWGVTRGWPTRPVPARVGPEVREPPVVAPPGAVTYGPAPPGYTIQVPPRQVLPGIIPTSRPGGYIEREGGRLGALGQWEDVGAWEEMGGGEEPTFGLGVDTSFDIGQYASAPDVESGGGGGGDWWPEPISGGGGGIPGFSPDLSLDLGGLEKYLDLGGDVAEERPPGWQGSSVGEFTQAALDDAARALVGDLPAGGGGVVGDVFKAGTDVVKALAGVALPVLKAFFPAGVKPIWTPCDQVPGTYWDGSKCSPKPGLCPQGQIWTGSGCRAMNIGDFIGGGGGGEGGGGFEFPGLAQQSMTSQWWFWPVLLGGGVLVLIVSTRRR